MKKILQHVMAASIIIFSACNDADDNDSNDAASDTSTAVTDTTPVVSNTPMNKTIQLGPDQEVPPNNSTAKGTADVSYNRETKMFTYTVNYDGLTGNATMAHIHGTAPRGANAGVKHDLGKVLKKAKSGSFSDSIRIDGTGIKEDSLLSGFYYFNIHTAKN